MNFLCVSHTAPKYNEKTSKWDMKVTLALNKPYIPMEFKSSKDAHAYICERMRDMHAQSKKDQSEIRK